MRKLDLVVSPLLHRLVAVGVSCDEDGAQLPQECKVTRPPYLRRPRHTEENGCVSRGLSSYLLRVCMGTRGSAPILREITMTIEDALQWVEEAKVRLRDAERAKHDAHSIVQQKQVSWSVAILLAAYMEEEIVQ